MLAFYFFAAVVIWLGILSLLSGVRFSSYVRRELAQTLPEYTPFVSVIAPFRGLESGLNENLEALFQQNYPGFEIIFVTDRTDDQAIASIRDLIARNKRGEISTSLVIAGDATDRGQKAHNLSVAVTHVNTRSEVLVFVDTDACPNTEWLRSLVAPLSDQQLGATTGYRWFVSQRGFASKLRSVWNASIASALGENTARNFCWGGSTAIRKSTFDQLEIATNWRGTISDDFTLTRVLQKAQLPIKFVPACLVASLGDCKAGELVEFTNRQLKITRVYAPHLWKPLLIGSLLFCGVFFGGLVFLIARLLLGLSPVLLLIFLAVIFLLGAAKSLIRLRAVTDCFSGFDAQLRGSLTAHLLLWPLASALFLFNALVAAFSQRLTWRGITYELKSATEAVIIEQSDKL